MGGEEGRGRMETVVTLNRGKGLSQTNSINSCNKKQKMKMKRKNKIVSAFVLMLKNKWD